MSLKALSDYVVYSKYAHFLPDEKRRESWNEIVERVFSMHAKKYSKELSENSEFSQMFEEAKQAVKDRKVLGSQRALQFGSPNENFGIMCKNEKIYNCSSTLVDRPRVFQEIGFLLLNGCGVGYSVQKHHVEKLPNIKQKNKGEKIYKPEDSIEGWAECWGILVNSYFENGIYPEYEGYDIVFDLSAIRPAGTLIAGQFKAPGPEPLRKSLDKIKGIMDFAIKNGQDKLTSLQVHDIICYISDGILAGGVRRCLPREYEVITKKGNVPLYLIDVGDEVLTPYGYKKVLNKFNQGEQQVLKIKTKDGVFECTPDHKMAVFDTISTYKWIAAKDLKIGDLLISNRMPSDGIKTNLPSYQYNKPSNSTSCTDITLPELDTDIAWFIGITQADGYVYLKDNHGNMSWVFGLNELDIAEKTKKCVERFTPNKVVLEKRKSENSYIVKVSSKQFAEWLQAYVKKPRQSLQIPDFIKHANTKIKMAYMAGILDGDGAANNKPIRLCSSIYYDYLIELQNLAYSCGIETRIHHEKSKERLENGWSPLYSLSLITEHARKSFSNCENLVKKLKEKIKSQYCNSFHAEMVVQSKTLTSKEKTRLGAHSNVRVNFDTLIKYGVKEINTSLLPVEIVNIEVGRTVPTIDIEVEDVHQFFANGILTHNSALISLFSKEDREMANCKTGNWYYENAQRARANNSVVLERGKVTKEEFNNIFQNIRYYGEPGFYFVDDNDINASTNPCCLVGETSIETNLGEVKIEDLVKRFADGENFNVKSYNEKSGKNEYKKVLSAQLTKHDATLWQLLLNDGHSINLTGDHKVYTKMRGYIKVSQLLIDDILTTVNSEYCNVGIREIKQLDTKANVYDLCVEDNHNFYANGILVHNCEIGFWPVKDGETGVSCCNLTEINGSACKSLEDFLNACQHASFIGTLQAGYDTFPYLGKVTEAIIRHEALLGVSITGWMDNPNILFNKENLAIGTKIVKDVNEKVAKIIGINPSARLTCTKPSGSASSVLGTGSGIHAQHARRYLRRAQVNKHEFSGKVMKKKNPIAVTESVWSATKSDNVVSFPCEIPENAILKKDLTAISFLDRIKFAYNNWVIPGTVKERGLRDSVTHNISCTVNIADHEWDEVRDYIYENRFYFSGISLLSGSGDLDYDQAPFVEVLTPSELVERYGDGVPLASGLIVDGLHAFDNLWRACDTAMGFGEKLEDIEEPIEPRKPRKRKGISEKEYANMLSSYSIDLHVFYKAKGDYEVIQAKKDWVRRAKQFAERYFNGDMKKMTYCLKHVSIWKDWLDIKREWKDIDWSKIKENSQEYIDADTMGAVACSGGSCEVL